MFPQFPHIYKNQKINKVSSEIRVESEWNVWNLVEYCLSFQHFPHQYKCKILLISHVERWKPHV